MRRLVTYLVALAAAAALAWWFYGREERGPELSHAEFVAEANRICAEQAAANARLEKPFRPYTAEHEEYFKAIHDNVDRARTQLGELNPPDEMHAPLDTIVDRYAAIASKLAQVEAATATDQDPEAGAALSELEPLVADVTAAERELGVCTGDASARQAILARAKATRPPPDTQGGTLDL